MQSADPVWGSRHNDGGAPQNINLGRDQNINRGYQNVNSGRQVGQVVTGALNQNNLIVGRDVNNFFLTKAKLDAAYGQLVSATAGVGASHKSEQQFERDKCLPGTRVESLGLIHDWRSSKRQENPICWLSGAAGVGKSAIAMTAAQECENDSLLASSFFFFRFDPKRNNSSSLISTLAHDLTYTIPLMRDYVEQRIAKDPRILQATLEVQFQELIFEPILSCCTDLAGSPVVPNVIVIDGLDECGNEEDQLRILSIIQAAYRQAPHFPLRFLICTRPEAWIREAFADGPLFQLSKRIILEDSSAAHEDIQRYFVHHFHEIVTSRKYGQVRFPTPWPSASDLKALVERACGQFIWAVVVVKFIKNMFRHPMEQLRIIIDGTPPRRPGTSPYQQLDILYEVILCANPDHDEVQRVLAAIILLPLALKPSPAHIELFEGLSSGQVTLTLRAMHSVLNIGSWADPIDLYHTSFRDYLVDRARSRQFHVDLGTPKHAIAHQWLQNLIICKVQTYSFDQLSEMETGYFFMGWIDFCLSIPEPTRDLLDDLCNVNLASVYLETQLADRKDWRTAFQGLIPWVRKYVSSANHGEERDKFGVVKDLIHKFQKHPKCFHLECSPGVPPRTDFLYWIVCRATQCPRRTRLDMARPSDVGYVHLIDCCCDISGGTKSCDPGHLAYQEACLQLVKAYTSHFEGLVQRGAAGRRTIPSLDQANAFLNMVQSSLLKHCYVDMELLMLCRTFFELAKLEGCLSMSIRSDLGARGRRNMFGWIETFPDVFAAEGEALKAQVLSLPWEQWAQRHRVTRR